MKLAVATCWAYRDALLPFFYLLDKFWPTHPEVTIVTDEWCGDSYGADVYQGGRKTWCQILAGYAKEAEETILLLQDDFFLTVPVQNDLVIHGLKEMYTYDAGCVRLYPCPGGVERYGDPYFQVVPNGERYRVSCQASLWKPSYLYKIVSKCHDHGEPSDFETNGTVYSYQLPEPVLAFKADIRPLPLDYLCSAISRGLWEPAAIELCEKYHIPMDRSMREVATPCLT